MLVSLIERLQEPGVRDVEPFTVWSNTIRRLRAGMEEAPSSTAVGNLREFLEGIPRDQVEEVLEDLIAEHLRLSWLNGAGNRLEAYFSEFGSEFPRLASAAAVSPDLVEDEFLARYQPPHGDRPDLSEYRDRFPARPDVVRRLEARFLGRDRYVRLHLRGAGAMGEVWECWDRQASKAVAVKRTAPGRSDDAEELARMAREAESTAGLNHPGIVRLLEFHEAERGQPAFYMMRLAERETLDRRIHDYHVRTEAVGPTARRECRSLLTGLLQTFLSVCEAAAHAHQRGVLHCDLKPGNVGFGENGEAVVFDWGMAVPIKDGGAETQSGGHGHIGGTPGYMAPEQAAGCVDARSDVFGLGAILYEILTGRPPHPWEGGFLPTDWRDQVREARISRPRRLKAKTPRTLEAICLKALSRHPGERYQSADALASDIRNYLAGDPVSVAPPPFWKRLGRKLMPGR